MVNHRNPAGWNVGTNNEPSRSELDGALKSNSLSVLPKVEPETSKLTSSLITSRTLTLDF